MQVRAARLQPNRAVTCSQYWPPLNRPLIDAVTNARDALGYAQAVGIGLVRRASLRCWSDALIRIGCRVLDRFSP